MFRSILRVLGLIILLKANALAQEVQVKNETILVAGKPYALLKPASKGLIKDLSLRTLQDKEVALAKAHIIELPNSENYVYYVVTFFPSGRQAELEYKLGFAKKLAEQVVQSNLIKENSLNPEGVQRFLQIHNTKPSERFKNATAGIPAQNNQEEVWGYVVNPATEYSLPERNRHANVMVIGQEIQQDFKTIGTVKTSEFSKDGTLIRNYRIFGTNKTELAVASLKYLTETTCTLVTLKDNKRHQLEIRNINEAPKEIADYLVSLFYL